QSVQVCTAAMHYGFRIVEDMVDGLSNWMDEKGFRTIDDFRGLSLPKVVDWKHLDSTVLSSDVTPPMRIPRIDEDECVGCNLCWLVCPVEECITMERIDTGRP